MDAEADILVRAQEQQKDVELCAVDDPAAKTPNRNEEDQGYEEALERKTKQSLNYAPPEYFEFFERNSTLEALIDGHTFE